jgi:hypothetical protein
MPALGEIVVAVQDDPIAGPSGAVSPGRVREECRVTPAAPSGMEHGEPCLAGRVETQRGDPRERAACGFLAVLAIDVEQLRHTRLRLGHRRTPHPAKPVGETVPDAGQALGAKPGDRLEPPVMRGGFQIRERLDPKLLVQAIGEYPADTGHGGEERDRVRFAPQPVEHGEPAVVRSSRMARAMLSPTPGSA